MQLVTDYHHNIYIKHFILIKKYIKKNPNNKIDKLYIGANKSIK